MPDNDRVFTLKAAPKKTIGSIPSLQPDSTADSGKS